MISKEKLLELMPTVEGKNKVNYSFVKNDNIIKVIHKNAPKAAEITKNIAQFFKGNTTQETCQNIWNFLRTQIKYVKDSDNQDIKLPNRFLKDGTGDCKSYSLFAGAILDNLGIQKAFRYTSYTKNPVPQHVYVVALNGNNESSKVTICDGVWHEFNKQKAFTYKKDYMPIRTLSGTDDNEIGKLGLKKLASKIQDKVKDTAVVKKAADIQNKAKDTKIVQKAAQIQNKAKDTKVVQAAAKAQNQVKASASQAGKNVITVAKKGSAILKDVPQGAKVIIGAPGRRAFRTLVALNFHNYANKLNSNKDETFRIWKGIGGIREELEKSINAGLKRRAILGIGCLSCEIKNTSVNGIQIGDPATIATALAAAAPVIAVFSGILKEALDVIKKAKDTFKKDPGSDPIIKNTANGEGGVVTKSDDKLPDNFVQTDTGNQYSAPNDSNQNYNRPFDYYYPGSGNPSSAEGESAAPKEKPSEEKKDNTALLVGGAILAKLLFF